VVGLPTATVNARVVGVGVGTVDAGEGEDVLASTAQDAPLAQAGGGKVVECGKGGGRGTGKLREMCRNSLRLRC
jgi:hypothetical protein